MYPVSNEYIDAMMSKTHRRRLTGTVGQTAFTHHDLIRNSFRYTNKAVSKNDITLGSVFVGELDFTFRNAFAQASERGKWVNKVITLSSGLFVGNDYVDVPLGVFTIASATWQADGLHIKAYDNMIKFDKNVNFTTTGGTLYSLLSVACTRCNMTLGMTQAEVEALPNGTENLGEYPTNDVETYRDFISWLAQTAGGFATIDRNGALVIKNFASEPVITLDENKRKNGCSFSDFESYYTGINVVDIEAETTSYYGLSPDTGLTMNLGSNTFLQFGLKETVTRIRRAVLIKLAELRATPFKVTMFRDPAFDLGDVIAFTGRTAGALSRGCIMYLQYSFTNGMLLQGYGSNPLLANAKSKTDKNIAGIVSRAKADTLQWLQFRNSEEIELPNEFTKSLGIIRFALAKDADVDVQTEVKFDLDIDETLGTAATVKLEYYLDGTLIAYSPVETYNVDGFHTPHYGYHLQNVSSNTAHDFDVRLTVSGGSGVIDIGDSAIVISSLGMVENKEWDGNIAVEDEIPTYIVNGIDVVDVSDSGLNISLQAPLSIVGVDNVPMTVVNALAVKPLEDGPVYISVSQPEWWHHAGEGLMAGDTIGGTLL